jgi:hypothetical protein
MPTFFGFAGTNSRRLSISEEALAGRVFGASLPPFDTIYIDDGLGFGDRPYTFGPMPCTTIHIGPVAYPNCTSRAMMPIVIRPIDAVFIHEMTHVMQYNKFQYVVPSSIWAQTFGGGYSYTVGQPWNDYNVEQQAEIVSRWYELGMPKNIPEFQYVSKVVRRNGANSKLSLAALTAWQG